MSTRLILGEVRFSYMNVFEPKYNTYKKVMQYSVEPLISKGDKALIDMINAAVEKESDGFFGRTKPTFFKHPLKDGDVERVGKPEYMNHFFLKLTSLSKPGVVDMHLRPIFDKSTFTSGDWGRVSCTFRAFSNGPNEGVAAKLGNLQFTRKGKPFLLENDEKVKPEDEFTTWSSDESVPF